MSTRNVNNLQAGSILIYTLFLLVFMLSIGLTLSGIFVSKLRTATEASAAVTALYAANSGAELCTFEARKEQSAGLLRSGTLANGATFELRQLPSGLPVVGNDCSTVGSQSFNFLSVGRSRFGTTRSLEITQ